MRRLIDTALIICIVGCVLLAVQTALTVRPNKPLFAAAIAVAIYVALTVSDRRA